MSLGFPHRSSTHSTSLKSTIGAALVGVALLGGTFGSVTAQEASPAACAPVAATPASAEASPVAASWITDVAVDPAAEATGDSTTVGVIVHDPLEINVAEFEARPFVVFQIDNQTDSSVWAVIFSTPEGFDNSCFAIPADVAELPEGVTPVASADVAAQSQVGAVISDLVPGSYVLATSEGQSLTFTVIEQTAVEVPDIFASPEG